MTYTIDDLMDEGLESISDMYVAFPFDQDLANAAEYDELNEYHERFNEFPDERHVGE